MITHHDLLFGMAILCVVSAALLILNLLAWRQNRRILARLLAQEPAGPGPAATIPSSAVTDIPTSLLVTTLSRLEQRIMQVEEGIKERPVPAPVAMPLVTDPDTDTRYERAQQLIQEAHSAEQVARGSGLTLYEAELLLRIQRGQ
ncbi:DUF2802 domain-containing protein [Frateuria aurantia]